MKLLKDLLPLLGWLGAIVLGIWAGNALSGPFLGLLTVACLLAWLLNIATATGYEVRLTFRPWLFMALPLFVIPAWCAFVVSVYGFFR
jgi:hypothetical protein